MNLYRIRLQANKAYWANKFMNFNFKWGQVVPMTEIKFIAGTLYVVQSNGQLVRVK